ncbi:tyrosine-protein phosphatase, partial [uncultured Lactobacillus sp.]|uniref:tyrosine-protein phosphatase n=1 Tax=uncultured Lactobacillus sp. TaxID=153152 RepID=UPI0025D8B960
MKKQPYILPNISMKRDGDQLIIKLQNENNGPYQLLIGDVPELEKIQKVIAESSSGDFTVKIPRKNLPKYYIIKSTNSHFVTNIFAERVIPLENAINIRDMGGYSAKDGRFLKWGVLFRGDQLSKLNDSDQQILTNYNL